MAIYSYTEYTPYQKQKKEAKNNNNIEIKLKIKTKTLKDILEIQKLTYGEIILEIKQDGVEIKNVDPSHVYMVKQKIPNSVFEEYNIDKEINIGLNVEKTLELIKNSDKKGYIVILKNSDNDKEITLLCDGFKYNINLLNVEDMFKPKIPQLDLPIVFSIDTKTFYNFLDKTNKITDHCFIKSYSDKLILNSGEVYNDDNTMITLEYDKNDLEFFNTKNNIHKVFFSTEIIFNLMKKLKTIYEKMLIYFNTDNPIKFVFTGEYETMILLAPKIFDYDDDPDMKNIENSEEDAPEEIIENNNSNEPEKEDISDNSDKEDFSEKTEYSDDNDISEDKEDNIKNEDIKPENQEIEKNDSFDKKIELKTKILETKKLLLELQFELLELEKKERIEDDQ